jgi:hypothetical protein
MPRRKKTEVPASQEVPAPEPGGALGKGRYRWTVEQTREQMELVEALLVGHTPARRIEDELRRRYGANRSRAVKLVARVRAKWESEDADKRALWKQQQIRSLEKTLGQIDVAIAHRVNEAAEARAKNANLKKGEKPRAVKDVPSHLLREKREYIEVLAMLTGTKAPEVVVHQHQVSASVQMAIAQLTSDDAAHLLEQMARMEQLAAQARGQGLLTEGSAQ